MLQRIAVLLAVSTLAAPLVACPSGGAASGDALSWLSPEHQARTTDALNRAQALARLSFVATAPSAGNDVQAADSAWPRPGSTTRASVPWHGGQSDLFAGFGGISSDGRVAVWESNATDSSFVPDDTNGKKDVFARDLPSKQTVRASVASDGAQADLGSSDPAVSGDGRYVVFASAATNLVPGDPGNGPADNLFIHDLATRTTERVSISTETGEPPNDPAFDPGVSHDGRYVVFQSYASNLVEKDTNLYPDIYVIDRATGSLEVVSVDSTGAVKDGGALYHSISPDGRYVAFSSFAALVPNDANTRQDVFVHDRQTGETELVSISTDGVAGDRDSRTPSISEGGRYVAFGSLASTLVPQDANNAWDIFVRDLATGTTRRVSARSSGAEAQSGGTPFAPGSFFPSISSDGRYVAIQSDAPNLMPGDTADWDVFVHDLVTGSTTPVAYGTDSLQPDKGTGSPDIGSDGRFVGLSSNSTNLVPEGNDQWHDVFVHDRGPSAGIGGLSAQVMGTTIGAEGWATFSGNRLASVQDPADDAQAPGSAIGSELTGFALAIRPELADLFVRWEVAQLPGPGPLPAGVPGVVHAVGFNVDGVRYEIRAAQAGAGVPPRVPFYGLYRCDLACTEVQALEGGYGETGLEITSSVALGSLGLAERNVMDDVVVFSGAGEAAGGVLQRLDEIVVGDVPVPEIEVSAGVAPAGTDPGDVAFNVPASFSNGRFTAELPTDGLAPGAYDVWARGCLGQQCGTAASRISLGPTAVVLRSFTARRSGSRTVALRWRTGTEAGLLGFNVYRQRGAKRIRLNRRLIASQNATEGTYAFGDRLPKDARARYWLQAVKTDGSRVWLGSATAR